ncbi:MAG: DUF1905 domain-containing protein [Bacteroidia bacterium]|nr:DUF1905 domain-containing protein [Bacteroidota bacterium]MBP6511264.1 DUF1905 domain-containing protein [Bacteroidia bacterium]MBP7243967.1 DUF1905 domain-containing protein [Bacteroidia bacterium]
MKVKKEKPLVDKKYLLEKYPGKGGWTYAVISEILQEKKAPFGWVKVKGSIDNYTFKNYTLMPMGNGKLFLPVKASIRKEIGKQEGDWVQVILYTDNAPTEIPEEFLSCLRDAPKALQIFNSLTNGQQKEYIDWIYGAKTDEVKVARMVEALKRIEEGKKLRDK